MRHQTDIHIRQGITSIGKIQLLSGFLYVLIILEIIEPFGEELLETGFTSANALRSGRRERRKGRGGR
jgi:hypothetical protein